jgi:hypothetical protein
VLRWETLTVRQLVLRRATQWVQQWVSTLVTQMASRLDLQSAPTKALLWVPQWVPL